MLGWVQRITLERSVTSACAAKRRQAHSCATSHSGLCIHQAEFMNVRKAWDPVASEAVVLTQLGMAPSVEGRRPLPQPVLLGHAVFDDDMLTCVLP
jgi:hypothetical protein